VLHTRFESIQCQIWLRVQNWPTAVSQVYLNRSRSERIGLSLADQCYSNLLASTSIFFIQVQMHLTAAHGLISFNVKKLIVIVYEYEHFRGTMFAKIGG
jgi:hypothetical protein